MLAVFKKECNVYFGTPFGLVFVGIFLILSGVMFTTYNMLGMSASMSGMFDLLKNFTVIFFPILVMKMFAGERERGTEGFLLTSRVKIRGIVLGKYLAACCVFAAAMAVTLLYVGIIVAYGSVNWGSIIVSYVGFYLLGMGMIAVCMFVASFADTQVSAAVLSFGVLFLMVIMLPAVTTADIPVVGRLLRLLDIGGRYDSFVLGVLTPGPILYYIGFSAVCVYLTVKNMEFRRLK